MVKRKKMWANRIPVPFPKNDLNFNGYTHKTCMKDNNILIDYALFYLREMVCDVKYSFSTIILYGTYIVYRYYNMRVWRQMALQCIWEKIYAQMSFAIQFFHA